MPSKPFLPPPPHPIVNTRLTDDKFFETDDKFYDKF